MTIQILLGETQAERTINEMLKGRANNVGEVTLDANVLRAIAPVNVISPKFFTSAPGLPAEASE